MTVIRLQAVPNFHTLPQAEAEEVINDVLLPAFKARRIGLCGSGIVEGRSEITGLEIERIQRVFSLLHTIVMPSARYWTGNTSYGLKHIVQERTGQYSSNGEFIAAMLLRGYSARTIGDGDALSFTCHFRIKLIEDLTGKAKRARFH